MTRLSDAAGDTHAENAERASLFTTVRGVTASLVRQLALLAPSGGAGARKLQQQQPDHGVLITRAVLQSLPGAYADTPHALTRLGFLAAFIPVVPAGGCEALQKAADKFLVDKVRERGEKGGASHVQGA